MADYTKTREMAERIVYRIPAPTVGAELAKALSAATQEVAERFSTIYDDSITIEVTDDEILLIIDTKPWTRVRDE